MSALPVFSLDPATYVPHALHATGRDWRETNCYVDVWIELLHALGLEVPACLAFTLAVDFEGDQWTFHKPPHADLTELYGLVVDELTLWRPLQEHCAEQIARGSVPLVEMDSYYLPDTCGSDYRENHVKTTIGVARACRDANVPCVCVAGAVDEVPTAPDEGLLAAFSICDRPMSLDDAIRDAVKLIARQTEPVVRLWRSRR